MQAAPCMMPSPLLCVSNVVLESISGTILVEPYCQIENGNKHTHEYCTAIVYVMYSVLSVILIPSAFCE